jgi:hypothetical protein
MFRKLLEDLWALTSSHFLAAEVLGTMPASVHPLLIATVVVFLAILVFRGRKRRKKRQGAQRVFVVRVERGPRGTSFGWERKPADGEGDHHA